MKIVKSNPTGNKFVPFVITLEVETDKEARLLWHVFNAMNLKTNILDEDYLRDEEDYNLSIAEYFKEPKGLSGVREEIEKYVKIYNV